MKIRSASADLSRFAPAQPAAISALLDAPDAEDVRGGDLSMLSEGIAQISPCCESVD